MRGEVERGERGVERAGGGRERGEREERGRRERVVHLADSSNHFKLQTIVSRQILRR